MKQFFIIGIMVLTFASCNVEKKPSETLGFCENELSLLSYDSLAPVTKFELAELRYEVWNKFDSTFEDFYCKQVRLKVNCKIDSIKQVKLLLYSSNYKNCDYTENIPPPPFNPYVHWIHIYLDKNDSLYIRRKFSSLDSIENEVIKRYHELPIEKYSRVNIALLWDVETDMDKFSKLVKDCIKGYLFIVNEVSIETFQKPSSYLRVQYRIIV